jgi:hypothetical protein
MRIGMLSELHPELCHGEICQLLMRARQAGDESLAFFTQETAAAPAAAKAARKAVR